MFFFWLTFPFGAAFEVSAAWNVVVGVVVVIELSGAEEAIPLDVVLDAFPSLCVAEAPNIDAPVASRDEGDVVGAVVVVVIIWLVT